MFFRQRTRHPELDSGSHLENIISSSGWDSVSSTEWRKTQLF